MMWLGKKFESYVFGVALVFSFCGQAPCSDLRPNILFGYYYAHRTWKFNCFIVFQNKASLLYWLGPGPFPFNNNMHTLRACDTNGQRCHYPLFISLIIPSPQFATYYQCPKHPWSVPLERGRSFWIHVDSLLNYPAVRKCSSAKQTFQTRCCRKSERRRGSETVGACG